MYVNSINFFSRRVTEPPFEKFPQQRHSILLAATPIGGAIVEYGSVWHLRSPCTSHRLLGGVGTKPSYLYNLLQGCATFSNEGPLVENLKLWRAALRRVRKTGYAKNPAYKKPRDKETRC